MLHGGVSSGCQGVKASYVMGGSVWDGYRVESFKMKESVLIQALLKND